MSFRGCQFRHRPVHGWAVEPSLLEVRVREPDVSQRRGLPDLATREPVLTQRTRDVVMTDNLTRRRRRR